ncbi:MAG: bacillithiol biosynthesis cysteine-adding enzyme BshC [Saprospiraceae bacterium]|nr:bacillithiol biosynthesis cysteine-adding enzyme BshC [Saprospiraceae bacterium]
MKVLHVDYTDFGQFSSTDTAYASLDQQLLAFAKYQPTLDAFKQVIEDKSQEPIDRQLLCEVLNDQYSQYLTDTTIALPQIASLQDKHTYTIVTAHQPVLFTGPSYLVYKIISAIKLTRLLKDRYPKYKFIPVFVTGGEDHDFDEMDHMHIYGKTIRWENNESGSVGRMSTNSLTEALSQLKEILGDSPVSQRVFSVFEKTHTGHKRYSHSFADLINGLFGHLGLVVANMDDARLKAKMVDIFKDEILHQQSAEYVRNTQSDLEKAGFKSQAYARDINLFFLHDGVRARIEKNSDYYHVVDTDFKFKEDEILQLVEDHPEKFSPNVIIRPLYQERVLPNLAYVGGGGELAYWLERKQQFQFFGINFPMLVRRDSCLWVDKGMVKKMNKLDLEISDFFQDEVQQIKTYVAKHAEHEFSLQEEKKQIEKVWQEIESKANAIDPTLKGAVASEASSQLKNLDKIEDRLRRAEKQKHDVALGQIKGIREKLYPEGGLQERYANFLEFYCRHSETYLDVLLEHFNPLDMRLKVIIEE